MSRDKELFDDLLENNTPEFKPPLTLTVESLIGTKMTWPRSAIRNAFLCLLANREPVHLGNNSRLDLINGGISDFTSPQKHHIFPQAFLKRSGPTAAEVHSLPNFCFLPGELNRRILDDPPSTYFSELRQENKDFDEATKKQLIPTGEHAGITSDDYLQFLNTRAKMILREIEYVTGISTAPPEDRRQRAVEQMEHRLRDLIHNTMTETHGADYWKTFVPGDVKLEAERRIQAELKKQPERKPEHFDDPREKLNYCNPSDYSKIILPKNNWTSFEGVFRRKPDLERYLEYFSEFRNAVMHGRVLTEITKRSGELALIWLETVLPAENDQETEVEPEYGNA